MKHPIITVLTIIVLVAAFVGVALVSCTGCMGRARSNARRVPPPETSGLATYLQADPASPPVYNWWLDPREPEPVPLLGDIPALGVPFSAQSKRETPRILAMHSQARSENITPGRLAEMTDERLTRWTDLQVEAARESSAAGEHLQALEHAKTALSLNEASEEIRAYVADLQVRAEQHVRDQFVPWSLQAISASEQVGNYIQANQYAKVGAQLYERYPELAALEQLKALADRLEPFAEKQAAEIEASRRVTTRLQPGEELWVIARTTDYELVSAVDAGPGCGSLVCNQFGEGDTITQVPMPLKHTDVKAAIDGYIATVRVTQQYHNPFDSTIEAVYVFPLPQNAAINEFLMTVGDRTIRGIIRERQEAEQIYAEAKRQGHTASLMTQERANIFTQKVANIDPGKDIDIDIQYFNTLAFHDGSYTFTFPMVVGPRFNPPFSSDGVGAVARGEAGISGQATEVQYLRPTERSGHDIALAVDIDAGVPIESLESRSHVVHVERDSAFTSTARVVLSDLDAIPNKDFVLRYKVAGDSVKSAMLVHADENEGAGGYFTLMLYPPANLEDAQRGPMEMVFVIDCSGSMNGEPIRLAKQAIERVLRQLRPDDTFQIIRFSNRSSALGPAPIAATKENVQRGLDYVASLSGGGGTMMIEGIKAALDFPHDDNRLRFVCFLTDGFIGNERDILKAVNDKLGASRIFSVGIGSSPNRYLLERLAKLGRGAVAYVGLKDSSAEIMDAFFARVSSAALTDIEIDWAGMQVRDVYPQRLPDLFVGRPVVLTGRYEGTPPGQIVVRGTSAGSPEAHVVATTSTGMVEEHKALPFVWARMKIADLMDRATWDTNFELADIVRDTALEYGIMSAYTAFVAVDSLTRTTAGEGTTVPVAVPVPEGVKYETTVREGG